MLTTRRKHDDTSNFFSEYYTLPSRCVKILIDSHLGKATKDDVDEILNEICDLHKDKPKGRELWWLAKSYYILGHQKEAKDCQILSQKDINQKAKLIRDENIRNDYLKLPALHKQIFSKIETTFNEDKIEDNPIKEVTNEASVFKFCPSCGFKNENSFKFCPSCGASLLQN